MGEQNVSLGAAHHRLVDGAAEQSLEKAAFAAADDDHVGVPLLGELLTLTTTSRAEKTSAISAARPSARSAASDPS
jgi:hypothetical protein